MISRPSNPYWRSPPRRSTGRSCSIANAAALSASLTGIRQTVAPLTVEELEAGLQALDRMGTGQKKFWDEQGGAFVATVQLAIRETAEALLFQEMPYPVRVELEGQLAWLSKLVKHKSSH